MQPSTARSEPIPALSPCCPCIWDCAGGSFRMSRTFFLGVITYLRTGSAIRNGMTQKRRRFHQVSLQLLGGRFGCFGGQRLQIDQFLEPSKTTVHGELHLQTPMPRELSALELPIRQAPGLTTDDHTSPNSQIKLRIVGATPFKGLRFLSLGQPC